MSSGRLTRESIKRNLKQLNQRQWYNVTTFNTSDFIRHQNSIDQIYDFLETGTHDLFLFSQNMIYQKNLFDENFPLVFRLVGQVLHFESLMLQILRFKHEKSLIECFLEHLAVCGFSSETLRLKYSNVLLKQSTNIFKKSILFSNQKLLNKLNAFVLVGDIHKSGEGFFTYVSKSIRDTIVVTIDNLRNLNITNLMPDYYRRCHSSIMKNNIEGSDPKKKNHHVYMYLVDLSKELNYIESAVRYFPYVTNSLSFVA